MTSHVNIIMSLCLFWMVLLVFVSNTVLRTSNNFIYFKQLAAVELPRQPEKSDRHFGPDIIQSNGPVHTLLTASPEVTSFWTL